MADRINPADAVNMRRTQMLRLEQMRRADQMEARQLDAERSMTERTEEALFNPFAMLRNAETLEKRLKRQEVSSRASQTEDDEPIDDQKIDEVTKIASEFQDRNPEMQKRALLGLKTLLHIDDTPEEILAKVLKSYPDKFLADEALDFMTNTSDSSTKLGKNIRLARELLNNQFGREVRAGRNVNQEALEFSKQGLGSATALRDLYRDITGNPREPLSLFEELIEQFDFSKMKNIISFCLHSLGADMKSKGPSISRMELQRLFTETRTMQAILSVYRFFYGRMNLISNAFAREDLTLPARVTFDTLSKLFVKLLLERYPTPDKVLRLAALLGISDEVLAQIIIFTQFRDAMRGTSPRLFRNERHRQDLLLTLIETISELDDLLEDEDEGKEDEEDDDQNKPGWSNKDTVE